MSTIVNTGWLKDDNGEKFAPKTLSSQVVTNDGATLESKIDSKINDLSTIEVSNSQPTQENVDLWLNPTANNSINIPEINDSTTSTVDTWSSQKISDELSKVEPTGVTAGTYGSYVSGSYYYVPNITVDEYGRVTSASQNYLGLADTKSNGLMTNTMHDYVTNNTHITFKANLIGLSTSSYTGISITNIDNRLVNSPSSYMPTIYNVFVYCNIDASGTKAYVPAKYYCGSTTSSNTATVYVQYPSEFAQFNANETTATYYVLYERPYTLTSYK